MQHDQHHIETMIGDYERGRLSRRQLIAHLAGLVAASGAVAAASARAAQATQPANAADEPLFRAVDLNHIALSVSDVPRSRDFYRERLGLRELRGGERSSFLTTGKGWLALFQGEPPGLHHYCYSVEQYEAGDAMEKLTAAGGRLNPRREGGRVYFDDPDGLTVQVAAINR